MSDVEKRFAGLDLDLLSPDSAKKFEERLRRAAETGKVDAETADYFARAAVDYQALVHEVQRLRAAIRKVTDPETKFFLGNLEIKAGKMTSARDDVAIVRVAVRPKFSQINLGATNDLLRWPDEYKREWVLRMAKEMGQQIAAEMAKELWK